MPSSEKISEASATLAVPVASALHRHELNDPQTFSNQRESGDYYGIAGLPEMTKPTACCHYGAF